MNTALIILICVVALAAILLVVFSFGMVTLSINRKSKFHMSQMDIKTLHKVVEHPEQYPDKVKRYDSYPIEERILLMQAKMELEDDHAELFTKSSDGLKLRAYHYKNNSNKWIILVHGYGNNAAMASRMYDAPMMRDKGFNVLLPDLRAHGKSEGKWCSMGWQDRDTVQKWIGYILEQDKDAEIVLFGVSMGAATVMMTSGEKLPDNVKCIVEDCGFTSVCEQFAHQLHAMFKLPKNPFIPVASAVSKLFAGYGFYEASAVKQVAKNTKPMLFIHGEKDEFVPTHMVYPLYDACTTEKDILIVPDADHATSVKYHPDLFWNKVWGFVGKFVEVEHVPQV